MEEDITVQRELAFVSANATQSTSFYLGQVPNTVDKIVVLWSSFGRKIVLSRFGFTGDSG